MTKRFTRGGVVLAAVVALFWALLAASAGQHVTAEKWPAAPHVQPVVMTVPLAPTDGYHNHTFNVSNGGVSVSVYVRYHVQQYTLLLKEVEFHTTPNALLNAVRVDLETSPDYYAEISPADGNFGGSSTSLNDVPADWGWLNASTWATLFSYSDTPALRLRLYGVGTGSIENRFDRYVAVE